MMWFVKSRRAQSDTDYETWITGEVTPTLNVFDNATETRATVLIIDGTRVGDVRVYDDEIMQTVIQRWGTGGGNVPYVFPIQDGREMEKNQNGLGVGSATDPSYTLDQTGSQAVAYSIREDAKADNFSATEIETARALQATQPSIQSHHAQTFIVQEEATEVLAYDEYNDTVGETHHTLRAGTKQSTGALQNAVVRRLTPMECERLQGFPDGWTDDQADTSRYKQMGNAVTVNVVNWIGERL